MFPQPAQRIIWFLYPTNCLLQAGQDPCISLPKKGQLSICTSVTIYRSNIYIVVITGRMGRTLKESPFAFLLLYLTP